MDTTKILGSVEPVNRSSVEPVNKPIQTEGLIPKQWCDGCATLTWAVTPDEAGEIARMSPLITPCR